MSDLAPLFDQRFLRKIDRLSLVIRKRRTGHLKGARRSTRRGTSVEFADYRDYAKGDDPRRVDWNIYARLERPFVKLFEEEEDLTVHLLLDASRSMDWGGRGIGAEDTAGPTNKWIYARRVAAALGYIALSSGDQLTVTLLRQQAVVHNRLVEDERETSFVGASPQPLISSRFGPVRGKGQMLPLLHFLADQRATGGTDLNRSLRDYALKSAQTGLPAASRAHSPSRPGLAILVSDLFSPSGYKEGLSMLLARGYEGLLIQVLAPEEAAPRIDSLPPQVKLVDIESGHEQEATIDARMRSLYRRRLAAWQAEIQRWCGQRRVAYAPVVTDTPFDQLILFHLRQRGWVR